MKGYIQPKDGLGLKGMWLPGLGIMVKLFPVEGCAFIERPNPADMKETEATEVPEEFVANIERAIERNKDLKNMPFSELFPG